jgi:hypothetical protein
VSIGVPPGAGYRVSGTTASGLRHIDPALVDAGSSRSIALTTVSGPATLGYQPPSWHPRIHLLPDVRAACHTEVRLRRAG